jgi:hypothetical protein
MSRTDELGALGLARGWQNPGEAISELRTQRGIEKPISEIAKQSTIPDSASIIPTRPSPLPPAVRGSGWVKEIPIEPPLGEATLRRLDEITDAMLGPAVPKPKK